MHPLRPKLVPSHGLMLALCISMPWLNPFASSPSTAVIPLLVSWMLAACALLIVVEMPKAKSQWLTGGRALMGALSLCLALSLVWVPQVVDHALTAGLLAAMMCVGLMVEVGRRAATNEWVLRVIVLALLLAALISSVLGVLQYLGLARELAPWVNQPLKGDAFANLRQRNQFASLTSLGLVTLLGGLAACSQEKSLPPARWWMAVGLLNVLAAGVACSMSRTGAVQWLLISCLMAVWIWQQGDSKSSSGKKLMAMVLAAPVLILLWSLLLPWLAEQTTGEWGASMILRVTGQTQDYNACGGRQVLWRNVLALIAQHPWLGWGWGETDFAHFMTPYADMRFCDLLDNAHNFPLHLALEFGVPFALVTLIAMFVWIVRRQPWREQSPWRLMAWGILVVVGVHSMLEYPLWYGPFQMTFGLALGLLWSTSAVDVHEQELPLFIAALLFVGCLYAAWDFNRVGQVYRPAAARDALYRDDPLHHAKQSWLFRNQAEFAELTTRDVTASNAEATYRLSLRLMHYSPEERVVQRAIDSAQHLGQEAQAQALTKRLEDVKRSHNK